MKKEIALKSVVITGSTRGFGLCMAKKFLQQGCRVAVSSKNQNSLEYARKELAEFSGSVLYTAADVTSMDALEKLWARSWDTWHTIDFWINNAGQNSPYTRFYDLSKQYMDGVIDTNIKGMMYGSQVAAKNMRAQGHGQIWNMEGLGSNGMIQPKTIIYGMTKHALTYFTKGLALELEGSGVLAGRLSPGMMPTDFVTQGLDGQKSPMENEKFIKIINILGDWPQTVADFMVPRILNNSKNNAHLVWLTPAKAGLRFALSGFRRRKLVQSQP